MIGTGHGRDRSDTPPQGQVSRKRGRNNRKKKKGKWIKRKEREIVTRM